VTQDNVANASTPGYARQTAVFETLPFQPETGLPGGVAAHAMSARNEYAERGVRRQREALGGFDQKAVELGNIESLFDIGESGLAGALNKLYQAFTSWSFSPNDGVARSLVIERARGLAGRFVETARGLNAASVRAGREVCDTVGAINTLAGRIRDLNVELLGDFRNRSEPAVDTRLYSALEELAGYAGFTAVRQGDGSVTVLLGGRTPLVVADRQFAIEAEPAATGALIRDTQGRDVTAQASGGRLGALLEVRNSVLPGFSADLNRLAAAVADRVNATLQDGVDMNGAVGAPLFSYNPNEPAATLAVTSIGAGELAGALAHAPRGNGNALRLSGLADSDEIDGASFVGYYGLLAQRAGNALNSAREDRTTQQQLLQQARAIRDECSGVSLDEEAARLIQYQRSYQASARLVAVLSDLTEIAIGLIR
jgi:flagellar hook-associated protein 1 FlgK